MTKQYFPCWMKLYVLLVEVKRQTMRAVRHTLIFLLIGAGAQGQEVLGVEAQEALDQSRPATSWEGRSEGGGGEAQ